MKDTVGLKIRKVRELKNYSQRYVADKLSVSQSAYSDMENGKIAVSTDKLEEIAKILEVSKETIERFSDQMIFNDCLQSGNYNQTIYNNPIEKIDELYTALIAQLKQQIADQKEMLQSKDELISALKKK